MEQVKYKYYSTQRPVDIGTFPKPRDNPLVAFVNYDQDGRVWMEHDTILAWGELTYAKPLTDKEIGDYELRPSRYNPDVAQAMYQQAQVVGAWEDRNRIPEEKRLTWWHPDFGEHRVKEYVTPDQLAAQCRIAQTFPRVSHSRTPKKQAQPGAR